MNTHPTLAFIGTGRVGSTLALTLHQRGYSIQAIYSRTVESAAALAEKVGSKAVLTPAEAAQEADLIFLTVPDDAIEAACNALVVENTLGNNLVGKAVVHTSGVSGMLPLKAAAAQGAQIGGLHPMLAIMDHSLSAQMAFSDPAITPSPDVTFGVEVESEPLRTWLVEIIHTLNGIPLWLQPGQDRARYHAAGVIASNYTVTLVAEAMGMLQELLRPVGSESGISELNSETDERLLRQIIVHLVEKTLENIKTVGPAQALTGPIVRGDAGTVRKHLTALDHSDPELADLYRLLARRTTRLAAERGVAPQKLAEILASVETSFTTKDAVEKTGDYHANVDSDYSKDEG